MKSLTHLLAALALVLVSCSAGRPAAQGEPGLPGPYALVGGTLINGTGRPPLRNSVVLVRGDRIERVGTIDSLAVPEGYEAISTEGMTVLPGLWDLHVHLLYSGFPDLAYSFQRYADRFETVTIPASAEQMLQAGVTTVRDLGARLEDILAVKGRIERGELPGPTVYAAGPIFMNGAPSFMTHVLTVTDAADGRAKTRALIDAGVDVIKVANAEQLDPGAFRAIVEEAHAAGLKVAAHGRTDAEIRLGLAAGVDDFQHIGGGSPEYPADVVASLRQRVRSGPPLSWTPTAGGQINGGRLTRDLELLDGPENFLGLPADMEADLRRAVAAAEPQRPDREGQVIVRRKVEQLRQLGVELVFGTDIGTFGAPASQATWQELEAWVRGMGMDPMTAIRWATLYAARFMGADDENGSIEVGKYADLIAVAGNPLLHIDVLRDPTIVIRHGRRYR